MADLRALKDKAADLAARGKLERAAEAYRSLLQADRRDVASRQRLAEVLRRAGRIDEAVEEYAAVAAQYGRDGLLAKAIALCKTILELDPAHVATQGALAELYAARARSGQGPRLTGMAIPAVLVPGALAAPAGAPPEPAAPEAADPGDAHVVLPLAPPPPVLVPAPPPLPPAPPAVSALPALSSAATPLSQILRAAQEAAAGGVEEDVELVLEPELEPLPEDALLEASPEAPPASPAPPPAPQGVPVPSDLALPRVPIFSDLSREAFIALTEGMLLQRVRAGVAVVQEGEAGSSFFVVATGHLLVTKRDDRGEQVRLARLAEGDFFGEMAVLAGAPRLATVTAEVEAEVLELRAEVLLDLAARFPHLATSLRRFQRQRLLANAMAVSPVFRPFSREDRRQVMARFRTREVGAGEAIVREGEPSDGLYVVLEGALLVSRRKAAGVVEVAELREGDVFGEMSCLRKTPATATVTARRAGTLLRLPRQGFDELVLSHPQVLEVVSELTEERRENLDAILSGHAQWTEEGLVLI
jgi:CRP-like cAMP-binding protein